MSFWPFKKKQKAIPDDVPSNEAQYEFRSPSEKHYIVDRLLPQISYYSRTSSKLRKEYFQMSIINIVLIASIPVLTIASDKNPYFNYAITAVSAIATILSSTLLLRRTKDNWLDFRMTAETLKSELAKYRASVGEYKHEYKEGSDPLCLFVENCEKIMKAEHSVWHSRMLAESDQE